MLLLSNNVFNINHLTPIITDDNWAAKNYAENPALHHRIKLLFKNIEMENC